MTATATATALPPRGFVAAGSIATAERATPPPIRSSATPVAARHLRGLRYQRSVESALASWADSRSLAVEFGPWFRFSNPGGYPFRWCQPDVIVDPGPGLPLVVLEVKLAFEPRAWWQLDSLYRPVVEHATGRKVRVAAICQSFDPTVASRVPATIAPYFAYPEAWLTAFRLEEGGWEADLPVLQWKRPSANEFDHGTDCATAR